MTKLLEWLFGGVLVLGIWFSLITNSTQSKIVNDNFQVILFLPVILLGFFGLYAVSVVLWRVYTFNDCPEAAAELQKEILLAKEDLRKRGMMFDTKE